MGPTVSDESLRLTSCAADELMAVKVSNLGLEIATAFLDDQEVSDAVRTLSARTISDEDLSLVSRGQCEGVISPVGPAMLHAATLTLEATLRTLFPRQSFELADAGLFAYAAQPSRAPRTLVGERSFVRLGTGWISLSLGSTTEQQRFHGWLKTMGASLSRSDGVVGPVGPIEAFIATAQGLGLAVLPASPGQTVDYGTLRDVDPNCSQSTRHLSSQLSGIRVLECGFAASAPFAGQLFHLLGADVTTVAHGARVASRWHGPEPLVLDFGNVVDFTYFKSLCVRADVVIDNFRPRVWTNLGVTPTDLGARLHLRLPGFARADERANWRSYGFQMEAHTGSGAAPWGDEQGCLSAPTFASLDHSVALFGVASTLASLKRSPHVVEVSQWTIASLAARLARRFFVRSSGE